MNNELIEKLESVGFSKKEQAGNVLSLHIKGLKFLYYIGIDEFCVHRNDHTTTIKSPNFAEILKTVEDSSNVELQNVHLVRAEEVIKRLEQLGFKVIEGVDCGIERRIKDHLIQYSKSTKILNDNTRIQYSRLTHHKFFDGFPKAKKSIKNPTIEEAEHFIESVFGKDFISKQQFNGLFDVAHSEDKPKQTKKQRITELENQIEVLTTNLQKVEDMVKDKSLELDKINERLSKLELESNNSLDTLRKALEATKQISNLVSDGGFIEKEDQSDGYVWANENILPKNVAEALTDKPKFKVGDKVVLTCKKSGAINSSIYNAFENKSVLPIESVNIDSGIVSVLINGDEYYFDFSEIEHAPKKQPKFKVGDEVMISENVIDDECCPRVAFSAKKKNVFKISQTDSDGKHCLDASYLGWFSSELLIPVAKDSQTKKTNFEIFDHAIVNTSKRDFKEGIEVVLVRSKVSLIDNVEYKMWCCYDKTGAYEYYYEEDLKPL